LIVEIFAKKCAADGLYKAWVVRFKLLVEDAGL
jgi:hypothetical protein